MKAKIQNTGINLLIAFALLFISYNLNAQYSYQSVLRDGNGDLLTNQSVGMKITVVENYSFPTTNTVDRYVETHTVTTNDNGLVSIIIGEGTVVTGDIENVQWSGSKTISGLSYFFTNSIKVQYDLSGGTSYTLTTEEKVLDVPTAAYAKKAKEAKTADNGAIVLGSIKSDGSIYTSKGISNIMHTSGSGVYRIELSSLNYDQTKHVVLVSPSSGKHFINAQPMSGDILVYIYDESGSPKDNDFQIALFKP